MSKDPKEFIAALPSEGVNLDGVSVEWLLHFMAADDACHELVRDTLYPGRALVEKLDATRHLYQYASAKVMAMTAREKGVIVVAEKYERMCQESYDHLPEFARW
jgi:hypothetical protein